MTEFVVFRLRRDTAANINAITPAEGEPAYCTDTKELRMGDGATPGGIGVLNSLWSALSGTSPALTFEPRYKAHTLALTGNTVFTASGYAQGYCISLFLTGDSSSRTLSFPSWTWLEGAPASLDASKKMRIDLVCTGSAAGDVFATYAVQS